MSSLQASSHPHRIQLARGNLKTSWSHSLTPERDREGQGGGTPYYLKHEDLVYHDGLAAHDGRLQGSSCHVAHSYARKYDLIMNVDNMNNMYVTPYIYNVHYLEIVLTYV